MTTRVVDTASAETATASAAPLQVKSSAATQAYEASKMSNDVVSLIEYSEDVSEAEPVPPLPQGDSYPGQIRKVEVKSGKTNPNNRYFEISLYIAPDSYPVDYPTELAPDGTTLMYRRLSANDDARGRYAVRKFCERVGLPVPTRQLNVSDWIGHPVKIKIEHESYEGENRAVPVQLSAAD